MQLLKYRGTAGTFRPFITRTRRGLARRTRDTAVSLKMWTSSTRIFSVFPGREAERADPQQRLLLEVAYEAIEDAGLPLEQIAGSRTGVFIGIASYDYGVMQLSVDERESINAYNNLGAALCIAPNRISYLFDLHGPSLAVDTACSSSLVATHLACQSLWREECGMALVGGVNTMLRPEWTIGFSKASMLAPDGRCKSFDAHADGYVRSEGAGVIVLKPLAHALADGDRVYALIRASAVNQDGRTGGISVPNPDAQELMLRDVYRQAGVLPSQVHYIKAHGTGTPVATRLRWKPSDGCSAASAPRTSPCWIGSVKSNIGHLEAGVRHGGVDQGGLVLKPRRNPGQPAFRDTEPPVSPSRVSGCGFPRRSRRSPL